MNCWPVQSFIETIQKDMRIPTKSMAGKSYTDQNVFMLKVESGPIGLQATVLGILLSGTAQGGWKFTLSTIAMSILELLYNDIKSGVDINLCRRLTAESQQRILQSNQLNERL